MSITAKNMDYLSSLAEELGASLKPRGLMLILAESCTGGMASQYVTSVAGSSAWFDRSFITYSNSAKIQMLGVNQQTLETFGAVSEQVATEMALGCLHVSAVNGKQALIAGSITGIAGPDGGTEEKPVGTVCFAWAVSKTSVQTTTQHFHGNRESVRQQAVAFMLSALISGSKNAA